MFNNKKKKARLTIIADRIFPDDNVIINAVKFAKILPVMLIIKFK